MFASANIGRDDPVEKYDASVFFIFRGGMDTSTKEGGGQMIG
jgi:hypothetical protein